MPRIPLYKLFLCVAIYAVPLALLSPLGWTGLWYGLAIGTPFSGATLLTNRTNIVDVLSVLLGGILGGFVGTCCLAGLVVTPDPMAGISVFAVGAVGVFIGGLIASVMNRRARTKWLGQ
jgi:hypothetical protein